MRVNEEAGNVNEEGMSASVSRDMKSWPSSSQPHTHRAFNTDASNLTIHLVQSDMIETQELLTAVKHKGPEARTGTAKESNLAHSMALKYMTKGVNFGLLFASKIKTTPE